MDAFTMELELCDEDGYADLDLLDWMRALGGHPVYEGDPFLCTGSAHLGGQHVLCTNSTHRVKVPAPKGTFSPYLADANHVDRLAFEVEALIADEPPDDPNIASVLESLAACHRVANRIHAERWYYPSELLVQTGTSAGVAS